jgi:hypothetical protein
MAAAAVLPMLAAAEKVPAVARSALDPETRGAVPRAGLRHAALAACLLLRLLLAVDAGKRDADREGVSVSSIIEDEKAFEKDPSKNRAP